MDSYIDSFLFSYVEMAKTNINRNRMFSWDMYYFWIRMFFIYKIR